MNALVLLSGGVDSSCCVAFYLRMGYDVRCVFVDYGQPANKKEEKSAKAIANYYGVSVEIIRCSGPSTTFQGEIAGRNAFLIFASLLFGPQLTGMLVLGIHSGSIYYDCSEHFVSHLSDVLSGYRGGEVVLATPLLTWTKQDIYDFCVEQRVPTHLTWSCELGPSHPCGHCLSCKDRERLNVCASK
jgi:7-cyano-7-deazaguanine synthase